MFQEKEVEKSTETKKTTVIEQNENFSTTISKSILKKEDPSDNWKSSPIQPTMTSIFGSSVTTPKSASFSFAQAFTDTNNGRQIIKNICHCTVFVRTKCN